MDEDRKIFELKEKLKEKQKKYNENMKQARYEEALLKSKNEAKKL